MQRHQEKRRCLRWLRNRSSLMCVEALRAYLLVCVLLELDIYARMVTVNVRTRSRTIASVTELPLGIIDEKALHR